MLFTFLVTVFHKVVDSTCDTLKNMDHVKLIFLSESQLEECEGVNKNLITIKKCFSKFEVFYENFHMTIEGYLDNGELEEHETYFNFHGLERAWTPPLNVDDLFALISLKCDKSSISISPVDNSVLISKFAYSYEDALASIEANFRSLNEILRINLGISICDYIKKCDIPSSSVAGEEEPHPALKIKLQV